jgi:hypothetical protein
VQRVRAPASLRNWPHKPTTLFCCAFYSNAGQRSRRVNPAFGAALRAVDDGPKLVDLIAALVAQQRDILVGIRRLQSDVNSLFDQMGGNPLNDNERGSAG